MGAIAVDAYPPSRTTMVTSSTRSACPFGDRVVRLFRGINFLAMTIRLHVQLDRLPQADDRTNRVQNERYARDAGDNERVNDDLPAEQGSTAGRIFHVLYQNRQTAAYRRAGVQCEAIPLSRSSFLN